MSELAGLDAAALLDAAGSAVRARRAAEVEDLRVIGQWAVLHSGDPTEGPGGAWARRVGDVLVHPGGEGTPGVQDFCLGELAIARECGVTALRNAVADVLDLAHRLPRIRAVVESLGCEVWVARRVASMTRDLPLGRVGVVDSAVAAVLAHESPGRVLDLAAAKVVEADPEAHAEKVAAQARRRYVGFSRIDGNGLRHVIARVAAGDAAWVRATLDRAVDLLAPAHPGAGADELASIAFGYLARPADLLRLLLEGCEEPTTEEGEEIDPEESREPARPIALPADLLDALRAADLTPLRPTAVLYLHLHEAVLGGRAAGVARVEGLGPHLLGQVEDLLRHAHVQLKPVIDLAGRVRSTAYEHPESLKERIHLVTGGDYFPWATSTGRRVDYDHPTPYDPTGPPGQTGTHNSGPLGRTHHRWKTHAGYTARQAGDCRYVWRTPHGRHYLVDHTGTRAIPARDGELILTAPPGVDIYPDPPGRRFEYLPQPPALP